jgi:hypothetical protein
MAHCSTNSQRGRAGLRWRHFREGRRQAGPHALMVALVVLVALAMPDLFRQKPEGLGASVDLEAVRRKLRTFHLSGAKLGEIDIAVEAAREIEIVGAYVLRDQRLYRVRVELEPACLFGAD